MGFFDFIKRELTDIHGKPKKDVHGKVAKLNLGSFGDFDITKIKQKPKDLADGEIAVLNDKVIKKVGNKYIKANITKDAITLNGKTLKEIIDMFAPTNAMGLATGVHSLTINGMVVPAHIDGEVDNGGWILAGAASGDMRGFWTDPHTYFSRDDNYGEFLKTFPKTSTFNAPVFKHYRAHDLMLQIWDANGMEYWAYAKGAFNNETLREVYGAIAKKYPDGKGWPSHNNNYERAIKITAKSSNANTMVSGADWNNKLDNNNGGSYWYLFARDLDGDNFCWLMTKNCNHKNPGKNEADQGIGACEQGYRDKETWFPKKFINAGNTAFDFGSNSVENTSFGKRRCLIFVR